MELSLLLSLGAFLICIYFSVLYNVKKDKKIPSSIRMLIATLCVIISLMFLHYASLTEALSVSEKIFRSFVNTLQSFSMDLDYDNYLENVGSLGAVLLSEYGIPLIFIRLYSYILGTLAPILGGAILLEVILTVFPSLKLRVMSICFWKDFCYFSELNDRSLALAESLLKENSNPFTRKVIIFTDSYSDDSEENETERLYKAKKMGAIILKRDICNIHIRQNLTAKHGANHFFLIDDVEYNNLQSLTSLAEEKSNALKKSFVYLFMQSDIHEVFETEIMNKLEEKYAKSRSCICGGKKPSSLLPVIKPIKTYKQIATNLFFNMPLYEPIVGRVSDEKGKKKLNVTIVGTGLIGTEIFLAAYWYGQIYGTEFCINFVTSEDEESFKKRIDYINTDIFNSGVKCGKKANSEILRIYPDSDEFAEPYFTYRYYKCDLKKDDIYATLGKKEGRKKFTLLQSDYVVVAIGSDEENIEIANQLKKYLALEHLNDKSRKTVVAFSVYDSDLCETVRKKEYSLEKDGMDSGVYMYPFASLRELYSYENIFMKSSEENAQIAAMNYAVISGEDEAAVLAEKKNSLEKIRERNVGDYNYWADHARACHIKYKAFASGYITTSVFTGTDSKKSAEDWDAYKKAVITYNSTDENQKHLAWMEHRRWNAFLRTMGYKKPSDEVLENYYAITGNHKNLTLKLHPFLAESDKEAMDRSYVSSAHRDMLELANMKVCKLKNSTTDYKVYDYPYCDFE